MDKPWTRHFLPLVDAHGLIADYAGEPHPSLVFGLSGERATFVDEGATHYGFIESGSCCLEWQGLSFELEAGMFFSAPGAASLSKGGRGIVVSRLGFTGMLNVGGKTEDRGRLRYIDGCSDTVLIGPWVRGDACLNHLHFPKGISQTRHTHPTLRAGLVIGGKGRCEVPANPDGSGDVISIPLVQGMRFCIPPEGQHSFFTEDDTMEVIAFHPDSDTGPWHDDHPMVNRTYVNGVSASKLDTIRTTGDIRSQ